MLLEKKIAVVTGAGSGIGEAVAKTLAREGAKVALVDVSEKGILRVAEEIRAAGGDAFPVVGDVSKPEVVKANVADIMAHYKTIDILVNVAGVYTLGPAESVSIESFDRDVRINLFGDVYWCQNVANAAMIPNKKGAIVNISSSAGVAAIPFQLSYNCSKHGIVGLTRCLAVEWGKYDIRVNCVCPGITETPMIKEAEAIDPEKFGKRRKRIPLMAKVATPQDQANAVLFLVSELSSNISGMIMNVDGATHAMYSGYSLPDNYFD